MQSVHGIVQSVLFFDIISAIMKQFSRSLHEGLFSVCDALRKFAFVKFEKSGFIKISPSCALRRFGTASIHNPSPH